ncbi:uncharacterized protein LOC129281928 [Lytechinus pictus]|uniref:uncharacterized protein LOC129281928 n=1 Tax=Lytechinus pictus TaxID=7653 RepID=UPI0030B9FD3B
MHDKDYTGLAVDNLALPNIQPKTKSTTITATTAIVNPVLISQLKPFDGQAGGKIKMFADGDERTRRLFGKGPLDDMTKNANGNLGEDGDRLAMLQDEIATPKDKRRLVLGQILKLEEKKRRFIRNTRNNQGKLRVARQKRHKLEDFSHSKVDFRLQQVLQLEKEKTDMEEKLDRFEDIGIALAMQKEEKHRRLLETIDNAPAALYRKESELFEERHHEEVVRYQVLFGLFLTLLAVLLITYFCRYGDKEKPIASKEGIFY